MMSFTEVSIDPANMKSNDEVSIDPANMKSNDEVKTRYMPEKSKKKPSIMEGKKTGMVSMARKNRVCTYYTLLLGLHYISYRLH
uniref:Uncharacterized protein n=1 Tax=Pectobacterium versatile TaxID=2488639 RepID=A0A855MEF1_9GAMM|nr:hypothetical protein F131LOC_01850 [Pectobacterium versatile]